MLRYRTLIFSVFAAMCPLVAQAATFGAPQSVLRFGAYNMASSFLVEDGYVMMPDSQTDRLLVAAIDGGVQQSYPLSLKQSYYITRLDAAQVLITDTPNNQHSIMRWRDGKELSRYTYRLSYGPWETMVKDGVVWGSDRSSQHLTRFDLRQGRELAPVPIGLGPTKIVAWDDRLYVIEEGAPLNPTDDALAILAAGTGKLQERLTVSGQLRDMLVVDDELCLAVAARDLLLCGRDGRRPWTASATPQGPAALAYGDGVLFVLARGDIEEGDETLSAMHKENGKWRVSVTMALKDYPEIVNARHVAYDAKTKSVLVRGDTGISAFAWQP